MKNYKDKVVWITGASSGIGEALVEEFAKEGAVVIASSHEPEELERVKEKYKGISEKIYSVVFNLGNPEAVAEAAEKVLYREGELDITPLSFGDEVETTNSPYGKLLVSPSTNNYAVHLNLINGNKALQDDKIRFAINQSIDQEMLLNLSMLGEGSLSPTMVSPNFYKLDTVLASLDTYFQKENAQFAGKNKTEVLKKIVTDYQKREGMDPGKPLEIRMLTPESFLFLARDIRYSSPG